MEKVELESSLGSSKPNNSVNNGGSTATDFNYSQGSESGGGTGGKKIEKMGLRIIKPSVALERDDEITQAMSLLSKNENVMLLGEAGTGKTQVAKHIAGELQKQGKQLIGIPAEFFSGGTAGSGGRAMSELFDRFKKEELANTVFFIDEIHSVVNMGAFGIGEQDHDTPRNLLKPYLTDSAPDGKRIVMLGATTTKEYNERIKNRDSAFARRFHNIELDFFNLEQIQRIMKSSEIVDYLKKEIKADISGRNKDRYDKVIDYTMSLLDKFARYENFPEKGMRVIKGLLSKSKIESIDQEKIQKEISTIYCIPMEIISKKIKSDSDFMKLGDIAGNEILGQDKEIERMKNLSLSYIQQPSERPLSLLLMGPTGVGKTETFEQYVKTTKVSSVKFNMGEYKNPHDVDSFTKKLIEFIKKNYAGAILFDEIEKASPPVMDVLLSVLDKGEVGSGEDLVRTGAITSFLTSNLLTDTLNECAEILQEDGIDNIPENILRDLLVEQGGLRPEFVGRISSVMRYNHLSEDNKLLVADKLVDKKARSMAGNGFDFVLSAESKTKLKQYMCSGDKANSGVRGIQSKMEDFVSCVLSNVDVMSKTDEIDFVENGDNQRNNVLKIEDIIEDNITLSINSEKVTVVYPKLTQKEIKMTDLIGKLRTHQEEIEAGLSHSAHPDLNRM